MAGWVCLDRYAFNYLSMSEYKITYVRNGGLRPSLDMAFNNDTGNQQVKRCVCDLYLPLLTHWGRVTYICVGKLTIIASDNGLSPGRRQAIIWTNDGILLNGTLGTNFSEILIEIHTFSFKKMYLKMSSGKWRPFCIGLNVLNWNYMNMFDNRNTFHITGPLWRKFKVTSGLPSRSSSNADIWFFLGVSLIRLLKKWSRGRLFETPWRHHCNELILRWNAGKHFFRE